LLPRGSPAVLGDARGNAHVARQASSETKILSIRVGSPMSYVFGAGKPVADLYIFRNARGVSHVAAGFFNAWGLPCRLFYRVGKSHDERPPKYAWGSPMSYFAPLGGVLLVKGTRGEVPWVSAWGLPRTESGFW